MADTANAPTGALTTGLGPSGTTSYVVSWAAVNGSGTGALMECPGAPESIQAYGTWGSGTLVLKGTNEPVNMANPTVIGLTSDGTAAISLTANGLKKVWENVKCIQPVITGGTGTSVNVYVKCRL